MQSHLIRISVTFIVQMSKCADSEKLSIFPSTFPFLVLHETESWLFLNKTFSIKTKFSCLCSSCWHTDSMSVLLAFCYLLIRACLIFPFFPVSFLSVLFILLIAPLLVLASFPFDQISITRIFHLECRHPSIWRILCHCYAQTDRNAPFLRHNSFSNNASPKIYTSLSYL